MLAYAGMAAMLWLAQESILFYPQPVRGSPAAPPGWSLEEVALTAADATPLRGVLLLPPGEPASRRAVVIYFGGNAEEVTAYAPEAERHYGRRAVLLVNYRGYGKSGGRPGEKALVADALAIHDWAVKRADLDPGRICVHGRSLGSGVAVQLAAARPLRCIVLTSPFGNLAQVGKSHYPWLPVGWLLRHRFESAQHARHLKIPALVIYGGADTIIGPEHSERLADAWGVPAERLRIEGLGHNDLDLDPRYARTIAAFLDRTL
ncbi:MAG TPA: alpha/beta fold hydrolase [Usitatibacteraceae bacterium]|nr:alpha/beta fold hydrolase [Usitatibacteraceae bacterium]